VPEEVLLRQWLRLLARRHPATAYRRIHAILSPRGLGLYRKRVQRLWRDEGLPAAGKDQAAPAGPRMPAPVSRSSERRLGDRLRQRPHADGRPLKILTVTDEHTREALAPTCSAQDGCRRHRQRP